MIDVQIQFNRVQKEQEKWFDGCYDPRKEPARGVAVQIQTLIGKLNTLLHTYQEKVAARSEQSPVVQVTDLPGI